MSRRREKHLENAHYQLETWAGWIHTHQGENGVMGSLVSSYDGMTTDTPPHALVPRVDMPRQISLVDIAYKDAPERHRITIEYKYIDMRKVSRHAEDRKIEYIAGVLYGGCY